MKSRIAIFEGYGSPFRSASAPSSYGRRPASVGRPSAVGRPLGRPLGRRGYYVPERNESVTESRVPYRKAYRVKAKRNTPAMKRAQKRFSACAKKCAKRRGARQKFPSCVRVCLRKKSKR